LGLPSPHEDSINADSAWLSRKLTETTAGLSFSPCMTSFLIDQVLHNMSEINSATPGLLELIKREASPNLCSGNLPHLVKASVFSRLNANSSHAHMRPRHGILILFPTHITQKSSQLLDGASICLV
jgi:hypothetical protein